MIAQMPEISTLIFLVSTNEMKQVLGCGGLPKLTGSEGDREGGPQLMVLFQSLCY